MIGGFSLFNVARVTLADLRIYGTTAASTCEDSRAGTPYPEAVRHLRHIGLVMPAYGTGQNTRDVGTNAKCNWPWENRARVRGGCCFRGRPRLRQVLLPCKDSQRPDRRPR